MTLPKNLPTVTRKKGEKASIAFDSGEIIHNASVFYGGQQLENGYYAVFTPKNERFCAVGPFSEKREALAVGLPQADFSRIIFISEDNHNRFYL